MEQQTISIAKAGITTMLKARTSVLAAANPPSGRYDDLAALEDNIELQTTILSRFDLIFIVKDNRTRERDEMIARHVLDIHRKGGQLKTNSGVCQITSVSPRSRTVYILVAYGAQLFSGTVGELASIGFLPLYMSCKYIHVMQIAVTTPYKEQGNCTMGNQGVLWFTSCETCRSCTARDYAKRYG
jgi:DNA replicative helicase MCM subunit Mcm2 (Cdc46/Mcm family)